MDSLPAVSVTRTAQRTKLPKILGPQRFSQILVLLNPRADQAVFRDTLTQFSDEIEIVDNVDEACTHLYSSLYDLLLCDLSLDGSFELMMSVSELRSSMQVIVVADSSVLEEAVSAIGEKGFGCIVHDGGDCSGQIIAALSLAAHRQEMRAHEIETQTERNAYWAAANSSPEGMAILGEDGTIVFANECFQRFAADLQGSETCNLENGNIVELIRCVNSAVADSLQLQLSNAMPGSVWRSEVQAVAGTAPESRVLFYEATLSISEISGKRGSYAKYLTERNLLRRVIWVKDITTQKDQERMLRDLISTTTHDLKGPIGAISCAAELLSDDMGVNPTAARTLMNSVSSCARNALQVIDQLLKASAAEAGILELPRSTMSVADLINTVVSDLQPSAEKRQMSIAVGGFDADMTIFADRIGMYRVMTNLISNALKFSPSGGIVEVFAAKEANGYVSISVKDCGPGISASEVGTLFRRFSRLQRDKKIDGTGLGLFITKNIVDAHQGRIDVQSELGSGTTFRISLPAKR